jgi:hypothetical protein
MNTFTSKLDDFETKLQTFIEGKLSRLSPIRGSYEGLSHQLVSSMRSGTISMDDGILLAPDQFILLVHPSNVKYLSEDLEMLVALADLIQTVGVAAGLHFGHHPIVTISPNKDIPEDKIDIIARISDQAMGHTASLSISDIKNVDAFPQNAFLIVSGREVYPLDQTVINIGRRSSNHLAIEDPRVSRQHAQIRAMHGRYEIFDLDSTGGTFINQKRIKQSLLHAGDVISLAGVYLIYGQERSSTLKDTKELAPSKNLVEPDQ